MNSPRETEVPPNSRIAGFLVGSDFHDAWSVESSDVNRSALEHFMSAVERTPRWVSRCMNVRNRAVALVGLKHLGDLAALPTDKAASACLPGERVGIFTLFENTFDETLLGDNDKHLNVVLSIHRRLLSESSRVVVTVTTVVHVHNALGRLYMLPVKPMHRLIAPAVLAAIGNA